VLRALAKLGADIRIADAAEATYLRTLPQGTQATVRPLEGQALDEAIDALINTRLDPSARQMLMTSGVLTSAEGRAFLTNIVQRLHRQHQLLPLLEGKVKDYQTQQQQRAESAALERSRPAVQALTDEEFSERTHDLWDQIVQAKAQGQYGTAQRLQAERDRLFQARYPGRH
jgi:hypothetical protein